MLSIAKARPLPFHVPVHLAVVGEEAHLAFCGLGDPVRVVAGFQEVALRTHIHDEVVTFLSGVVRRGGPEHFHRVDVALEKALPAFAVHEDQWEHAKDAAFEVNTFHMRVDLLRHRQLPVGCPGEVGVERVDLLGSAVGIYPDQQRQDH